ncbi:unnamed protein product [Moneuplotes crassus]|uniref:Uncharacterized protein n=1 Tax=Euplotes crassus TaxID=5936 RepID=A0AAD1UJA3_EUPCR|nr:unnamed protein product [Moneuplotes crassus]
MENPYRNRSQERSRAVQVRDSRNRPLDISVSEDIHPGTYKTKDNVMSYDWRDDLTQSQSNHMRTQDDRKTHNMMNLEKEIEEDPRSLPKSPEHFSSTGDQEHLTYLLDTVLEAQEKFVTMFPNMGNLINEKETKSFEDITFCMLKQSLFLFDEYKKLNSRVHSDYISMCNKRLLSENDQLKKIKEQSSEIIKTLNENLCGREKRIQELQEHLEIANKSLPKGDIELRARREKDRDISSHKKLTFELNQKEEAIKLKDKSLKVCNQDIKKLKQSVSELKESICAYEEKNLSLKSQIRAKNDIIKRLESKILGFENTKSISVRMEVEDCNGLQKFHTLENYPARDSSIHSKKHSRKSNERMSYRDKPIRIKAKLSSKKKTAIEKLTGLNYDSLLAMTIAQAKEVENALLKPENTSYRELNSGFINDTTRCSNRDSMLKENKYILNRRAEPEVRLSSADTELVSKVIKYFQRGDDQRAIEIWKELSYCPLPVKNNDEFILACLKLRDIQLRDYRNAEARNSKKDIETAEENRKLKEEMDKLAEAVDKILREKGNGSQSFDISPMELNKLQDEVDYLENILKEKEDCIKHLEQKLKTRSKDQHNENRVMSFEENSYQRKQMNAPKSEDKVLEERMMELESIIHRIESTIFAFESKRVVYNTNTRQFDTIESSYGTYPDALKDFCSRLRSTERSLDRIISLCMDQTRRHLADSDENTIEGVTPNSDTDCDPSLIEREAENFLSRADQKYKDYFEYDKNKNADQRECVFKELFNLNHQLIKLLQKSEDRVEAETSKARRNKKALDEINNALEEQGRKNVLQEIKNMSQTLFSENDNLIEECVELRKECSRLKQQAYNTNNLGFYKEQIDLLEKKNELLNKKLKGVETGFQNTQNSFPPEVSTSSIKQRFEETNAALERAFDRISMLESENNKLLESINSEKSDRTKLQKEYDVKVEEFRKIQDQRRRLEMEQTSIRDNLRSNNDQVDQLRKEKMDIERRLKQITDEKDFNENERRVYNDSKKLFEEEIKTLKNTLTMREEEIYALKSTLSKKEKDIENYEILVSEFKKDLSQAQEDSSYYNVYRSGTMRDIIRNLAQEVNLVTCLTQLSHTPKEYAKGMKTLLDHVLCSLQAKNEDITRAHESMQKLSRVIENKEISLSNLEDELNRIQNKEIDLNRKKEEIFKNEINAFEKENRSLLMQLRDLTEDLKALKKRYDTERDKNRSLKKEVDLVNDELKIILELGK